MADSLAKAMHGKEKSDINQGKITNFVLETAANPSFLSSANGLACTLTDVRTVQMPNETFKTNRKEIIQLTKEGRTIKTEALIHNQLP